MRREDGRFLTKLRIYIFVICLVLCMLIIGVFEYSQITLYQRKQREGQIVVLNTYAEMLDSEIKELFEYADLLSRKDTVIKFAYNDMSELDKIEIYEEIRENFLMRNFPNGSVVLYRPEYDCFIAEDGIEHLAEIKSKYGAIPYLKSETEKIDKHVAIRIPNLYDNELDDQNIVFFKKNIVNYDKELCFLIVLKKSVWEKELEQLKIDSFYISDNEVCLMKYNPLDKNNKEILWKDSKEILNWKYGVAKKTLNLPLYFTFQSIILLAFAFCITSIASKYIATKIYKPIKEFLNRFIEHDDIYDEFGAVEEQFEYLNDKVENYNLKLKRKFLIDVFKGRISHNVIEREKDNFKFFVEENQFCVAVAIIDNELVLETEYYDGLEYFVNLVTDELPMDSFFVDNEKAILMYKENDRNNAEKVIVEKAALIEKYKGLIIRLVLFDKIYTDICELHSAYIDLMSMDIQYLFSQEKIAVQCTNNESLSDGCCYSLETENKLISLIKNGDKEETFNLLKSIFNVNLDEKKLQPEEIVEFKFALITTAKRVVSVLGLVEEEITDSYKISEWIGFSPTKEKLWEYIERFYSNVFDKISKTEQTRQELMFKNIHQYVLENFRSMDDISAVNLAKIFNISTGYIYKLYKKMIGKSFIDCVLELRVEEAKKLLETQPYLKVKEIAERVGYENPTSFMRLFKKQTGMSPNDYRLKNGGRQ